MSLRRRIVVAATAAVALAIVAASVIVYVTTRAELRAQVDDDLRSLVPDLRLVEAAREAGPAPRLLFRARVAEGALLRDVLRRKLAQEAAGDPAGARVIVPPDPLGGPTGAAQVVLADGRVVGGEETLPFDERAIQVARGDREPFFEDAEVDGTHVRVYTASGPVGDAIQVARPLSEVDASLNRLRWILLFVAIGGVGVAGGLGFAVSRTALAPVTQLTDTAEHVARTQDLSRRLPAGGADELARLGASFNTMLGALETSREAQRQLVADASHELRTPLTSVRANIELLGRAPNLPAPEREAIVAAATAQIEELSVLVGDLVDLARPAEPGTHAWGEPEDVQLDVLVADAVDRARRHAPECRFALVTEPTVVRAVPARVHRALGNLLDNAVKHGPPGGPVEVTVADGRVTVRDHGPGFAAEDVAHAFDRFYRSTSARGLPGSGLGLAIVRQVAEAHRGRAQAANAADGGALLVFELPVVQP